MSETEQGAHSEALAPGWDAGGPLTVREMLRSDIPAGLELSRGSLWNQTARDWEQFLALNPHGSRVAVRGGRVIGTVTTTRYEDRFAWVGMVLVDPAERGRGLGTRLLEEGLTLARDLPCVRLDATPAGHPIYLKRGFQDEYPLARMERPPGAPGGGLGGLQARPMTLGDLPAVERLDLEVFGARRPAMLRWLWADAVGLAWVVKEGSALRGYCLGRHGHRFEHVGPVVARDEGAARQLVGACLEPPRERPLILDASLHAPEWRRWLEDAGFREQRPFMRMFLGENRHPGRPEEQFAILGPEFG